MAGSLKWMKYASDDGKKYRVFIDESNGEAFDFDDITDSSADALVELPKRYEMRYLVWRSTSGSVSRKFPVGKATFDDFKEGGDYAVNILSGNALESVDGSFTYAVGEKRPMFANAGQTGASGINEGDTGLNDGDRLESTES